MFAVGEKGLDARVGELVANLAKRLRGGLGDGCEASRGQSTRQQVVQSETTHTPWQCRRA